jgi:predicted TIM-barrel fold metal-dependent hydrolase
MGTAESEDVIDPELEIVDAHHHLWGPGVPWEPSTYLLDDLAADLASGHRVSATVYIECGSRYYQDGAAELRPVGETEFAVATAAEAAARGMPTAVAAGIVAHADLRAGDAVETVLEAHERASQGRLRGIRHMVAPPLHTPTEDPGLLRDSAFRRGLARLASHGLVFEVYALQTQLGDVASAARALPELTFVIDHLGGIFGLHEFAGRRAELWPQWRADITALAELPNTYLKLSGLGTEYAGFGWHERTAPPTSKQIAEETGPYYLHSIDKFGVQRCLFASNFPPDRLGGSYRTLWNVFKRVTDGCTPGEKAALFDGTSTVVYRLGT